MTKQLARTSSAKKKAHKRPAEKIERFVIEKPASPEKTRERFRMSRERYDAVQALIDDLVS